MILFENTIFFSFHFYMNTTIPPYSHICQSLCSKICLISFWYKYSPISKIFSCWVSLESVRSRFSNDTKLNFMGLIRPQFFGTKVVCICNNIYIITTSIICIRVSPKESCNGSDSLATGRSKGLQVSIRSFSSLCSKRPQKLSKTKHNTLRRYHRPHSCKARLEPQISEN